MEVIPKSQVLTVEVLRQAHALDLQNQYLTMNKRARWYLVQNYLRSLFDSCFHTPFLYELNMNHLVMRKQEGVESSLTLDLQLMAIKMLMFLHFTFALMTKAFSPFLSWFHL